MTSTGGTFTAEGFAGGAAGLTLAVATGAATTLGLIALCLLAAVAVALWLRQRRSSLEADAIEERLRAGQPEAALALLEPELAARPPGLRHAELLGQRAWAEWQVGDWDTALHSAETALQTLSATEPTSARGRQQRLSVEFDLLSQRFACLLAADRVDDARALFSERLESLGEDLPLERAEPVLDAGRAQLAFFEDDFERSEALFAELRAEVRDSAVNRALYSYYLGCIQLRRGQLGTAVRWFDDAVRLAPQTWIASVSSTLAASVTPRLEAGTAPDRDADRDAGDQGEELDAPGLPGDLGAAPAGDDEDEGDTAEHATRPGPLAG
jgi:tetratricopeptide (TPR) repeat protein